MDAGDAPRGGDVWRALAFGDLYRRTNGAVRSFARRRVNEDHVEDVVSETYVAAWRRFEELPDDDAHALSWLYRTAGYALLNIRRADRRQRVLRHRLAEEPGEGDASHGVARSDDRRWIAAFGELSREDRRILLLSGWSGLSGSELGAMLGCSAAAAANRLSRARARLRAAAEAA